MTTEAVEEVLPEIPEPEARTLLETWHELLSAVDSVSEDRISPAEASHILRSWPNLKVQELKLYRAWFYEYMQTMRDILTMELELDPAALGRIENDAVDNHHHYLNLVLQWQLQIQHWTQSWDCETKDAHITMAAMAEIQQFFFGPSGMTNHLDQIEFEFKEDDAQLVAQTLEEAGGSGE